jgi:hypothetical protein
MRRLWLAGISAALASMVVGATGATAAVDPLVPASGPTPFAANCNGFPQTGTLYPNAEVEPYIASDPAHPASVIGVWQQDRWSNGGSNGLLTGVSNNGGRTWTRPTPPPLSHCAGGNAFNGGDYERASDPWVTFGPTGTAFQISLSFNNDQNLTNAVLVSRSTDRGANWGPITTLLRDTNPRFFNDKESITADPTNANNAYAIWDRLDQPNPNDPNTFFGPTFLSRTTNGGASWSRPRKIFDPGKDNQTIGNQIAVLPNGDLVDVFNLILGGANNVAVMRSTNSGRTWSKPVFVDQLGTIGVRDPRDDHGVRTGDITPEIAVDPRPGTDDVYLVWQDARFSGGQADQVAFAKSGDGGATWTPSKRISQNPGVQAFTPSIRVDANGRVGVTYYDFTSDTVASPTLDTDYWFARSTNAGNTFGARERVTPASFDMRTAPDAVGFFTGDYEGLTSAGSVFEPLVVLANSGNAANPTDVFATRVHAPFGGSTAAQAPAQNGAGVAPQRTPGRTPTPGAQTRH